MIPPCAPSFFASSNWSSYKHHDGQPQKYYFIVFSGINAGIYSLQSAAEKALPSIGKYDILRCDSIADAVLHWERLCSARHSICDLSQCVKLDNAAGLLALENHWKYQLHSDEEAGDSDKVNVPLESPARILTVVTSDAPLPNRRPPCPPVSPVDSAAARKLGEPLGTIQVLHPRTQTPKRNTHSGSPSADRTPPHSSRMASLPSEASAVSGAGTPSTRPLRALLVHSDTSSVEFISRVLMDNEDADTMPGVEPPPLSPTITSASSLSSSTAFSISTASTTAASTPAQGSATPAQGSATSAQRSAAPMPRGGLDLMMVDEDDDQQGPFFLNVTTLTMYRDMSVAMSDMEKLEKLQVFRSVQEVKEAMEQVMQKGKGKQVM
ncbi:hypothetical protein K438DRAFT_1861933 [Mycena galopus ATCC 62051]|nr:hypothetical protein K438DRAFT_1861933 [Mycena galopus ATCC 62051]